MFEKMEDYKPVTPQNIEVGKEYRFWFKRPSGFTNGAKYTVSKIEDGREGIAFGGGQKGDWVVLKGYDWHHLMDQTLVKELS